MNAYGEDSAALPDEATQKAFDRDGVVVAPSILSNAEVEALRSAVDRQVSNVGQSATGYDFERIAKAVWSGEAPRVGGASRFDIERFARFLRADADARPLWDERSGSTGQPESSGSFVYDAAAWRYDEGVRDVALRSALPAYCANLLNARYLNFWEDTTFVKMPGTRQRTAFHQDLGYFQIDGDQCVIVWIPLDPADSQNGVTEYVRGSHRWPETFASNSFIAQTPLQDSVGPRLPDIEANRADYDIVSFDVMPGDAVICHVRTVHGAGGNISDRPRRAMSFRYCGDTVRYHARDGALTQIGVGHTLSSGDRLISEDYPMAWPATLRDAALHELPDRVDAHLAGCPG